MEANGNKKEYNEKHICCTLRYDILKAQERIDVDGQCYPVH